MTNGKHFSMMKQIILDTGCEKEKYLQSRDKREDAVGGSICPPGRKLTLELRTEGYVS